MRELAVLVWGVLAVLAVCAASTPPEVAAYRQLLNALSKNTTAWAAAGRALRSWMAANDPDYPLYHLTAPEGWNNDPNGVTWDPHTGLYHRFYQYDPTYSPSKMHGTVPRTWGHSVSRDLGTWADWPGIYADSPWDEHGVFSGNCVFNGTDPNPICIYSNNPCSIGVCATSRDGWVTWEKRACMTHPPPNAPPYNQRSQTNHDTSLWRDSDTGSWSLLSGGCTFGGLDPNQPSAGHTACKGNAQLWQSADLWNFSYVKPITLGGPGNYWELPYLLPFDAGGNAIDNYQHQTAAQYVLAFGLGNSYWVGGYNRSVQAFSPVAGGSPKLSDSRAYYSINPHGFDRKGPGGSTRRLVFGWVEGPVSSAVEQKIVPYWQSAHSLLRLMTVQGSWMVQQPAPEVELLRTKMLSNLTGPIHVGRSDRGLLPELRGTAIEVSATFSLSNSTATSFGVTVRRSADGKLGTNVSFTPASTSLTMPGVAGWYCGMAAQPSGPDTVTLRIFVDRSVLEVYSGGAAVTARIMLPSGEAEAADGVDLFAEGGDATLLSLKAWQMGSMWGPVE